jgi:myosin heavy subunit
VDKMEFFLSSKKFKSLDILDAYFTRVRINANREEAEVVDLLRLLLSLSVCVCVSTRGLKISERFTCRAKRERKMNFVNTFVSNLEHLDQTAQTISKETDGDLKETIAKNLPFVTNKVMQEITARGFISGGGRNDDEDERKRRENLEDDAKRLESAEEILRALNNAIDEDDDAPRLPHLSPLEDGEDGDAIHRRESLRRQTELLLPALRALEAEVETLQSRANERKFREEEEAKKRMEARQHEMQESMRLERLLERERNARMELERFEEERVMAMKNDQGECEKTTRECRLAKEERRKESEKAEREKKMAEKEVEEIERRIAEAEERLRIERSRLASVSASTRTVAAEATEEEENAEERERRRQLNRLVEEAKRELKLLDEQIYEQNQNKARYRENSVDYRAEMQRRLRSLDEQLQFRRMKLAGLESQKSDAERELARCKNENNSNAASHRASVLDEFNVHPTGGGERGEKGTQRRRTAAAAAPRRNEGTLIDDNDDDDRKALKKGNTTRRQKLDASISLALRLLRDSPSIRGLFVLVFAFVHVYVFVSSAKHALHNDPNHREGKEHH